MGSAAGLRRAPVLVTRPSTLPAPGVRRGATAASRRGYRVDAAVGQPGSSSSLRHRSSAPNSRQQDPLAWQHSSQRQRSPRSNAPKPPQRSQRAFSSILRASAMEQAIIRPSWGRSRRRAVRPRACGSRCPFCGTESRVMPAVEPGPGFEARRERTVTTGSPRPRGRPSRAAAPQQARGRRWMSCAGVAAPPGTAQAARVFRGRTSRREGR